MGIYLVTKNNIIRSWKHKSRFLVAFILPILFSMFASFINISSRADIRVGVLSNEQIQDKLEQAKGIVTERADENSYYTDLIMGKYQVIIHEELSITTLGNKQQQSDYQGIIQEVLSGNEFYKTISKNIGLTTTERSLALLMTMFMIMATLNGVMLIRDKTMGTYFRYLYAPHSKMSYVTGNYVYNFLITLLQVSISLIIMNFIQNENAITYFQGIALSLYISLVATVFATIICLVCKSDVQANISASSISTILSMIGGTFVAVENMPTLLQYISLISPIRWVVEISRIL